MSSFDDIFFSKKKRKKVQRNQSQETNNERESKELSQPEISNSVRIPLPVENIEEKKGEEKDVESEISDIFFTKKKKKKVQKESSEVVEKEKDVESEIGDIFFTKRKKKEKSKKDSSEEKNNSVREKPIPIEIITPEKSSESSNNVIQVVQRDGPVEKNDKFPVPQVRKRTPWKKKRRKSGFDLPVSQDLPEIGMKEPTISRVVIPEEKFEDYKEDADLETPKNVFEEPQESQPAEIDEEYFKGIYNLPKAADDDYVDFFTCDPMQNFAINGRIENTSPIKVDRKKWKSNDEEDEEDEDFIDDSAVVVVKEEEGENQSILGKRKRKEDEGKNNEEEEQGNAKKKQKVLSEAEKKEEEQLMKLLGVENEEVVNKKKENEVIEEIDDDEEEEGNGDGKKFRVKRCGISTLEDDLRFLAAATKDSQQ